ncbi:S24 family peptidase [Acinetobacter bohemicus]|nr:S24 family peptidase [Acinetobacter sp. S4397-1]MCO8044956.1 S24 family peptidase [Acinetobacter sp. S4397-1]
MDIISLRRANLRQAIDAKLKSEGFSSDAAFCEHYDLNPSHISQLVKGHGSFGERAARNLERKVGWEVGTLDQQPAKNLFGGESLANVPRVKARMAPVLSWVQAGTMTNVEAVDMSQVEEWLPIPDGDCEKCFYLKVQGLSNYPEFHEGDYILVDPTLPFCDMNSGDIVVVRKFDDATFKRLVIEPDGTKYLQAINPEFKPNIIPLDQDCEFVGEVVDCIRYVYRAKKKPRKI